MNDERLMDIKEVADFLQVKESTIYTWAQEGTLPAFRVGRLWRFVRTPIMPFGRVGGVTTAYAEITF